MGVQVWTGAVSRNFKGSVCSLVSGADVLPSLAGWEKTKQSNQLRKGSSHHEATHYCTGIACCRGSLGQRIHEDPLDPDGVECRLRKGRWGTRV